jgi:hypothetical protein
MGKALYLAVLVGSLVAGQQSFAASPTWHSSTKQTAVSDQRYAPKSLLNKRLNRLYDAVPTQKDGPGVAEHLRRIALAAAGGKAPKFKVVTSPTVNKTLVKSSVRAYEQAMTIWQPLGLEKLDLVWAFMSEKDYDWWKARVIKYETESPDTRVWNPKTGIIGHCKLGSDTYCGYGNPKPSGKTFQYNVIGSRYTSTPNKNTVNHEAVHFYQDSMDTLLMQKTPCWFVEGQANLIGNVLDDSSKVVNNRRHEINRVRTHIPDTQKMSTKQWLSELRAFDGNKRDFCIKTELSYSLGLVIFEHLYANYSFRQMHELVKSISETGSFSQSVRQVLGTTDKALYRGVAKYLSRQF